MMNKVYKKLANVKVFRRTKNQLVTNQCARHTVFGASTPLANTAIELF